MNNLEQARAAADELKRLQAAAEELPRLEKAERRRQEKARLDALRDELTKKIADLAGERDQLANEYAELFGSTFELIEKAWKVLRDLRHIEMQMLSAGKRYASAAILFHREFDDENYSSLNDSRHIAEVTPGVSLQSINVSPPLGVARDVYVAISRVFGWM